VATGFTLGKRQPLGKRETGGYCRFEYMSEEQLGLIKAIAIHEKGDLSVVLDPETMYPIAEEYANAGIHFLHKDVMGDTEVSFIKKLEASLADKIKSSSK